MNEDALKLCNLLDLEQSQAGAWLQQFLYPWEALEGIGAWIQAQDPQELRQKGYQEFQENVWVHESAQIADTATVRGPCILGPETEVRPGAFLRGNVVVGANCVVGNSSELKNVILFNCVQVPHYNYVGDSLLGYKAHMGAGAITSNVKGDRSEVSVKIQERVYPTRRKKFGAVLGDFCEVGCNSVLNPGTVLGREVQVYPLTSVRGYVPPRHICKSNDLHVEKCK